MAIRAMTPMPGTWSGSVTRTDESLGDIADASRLVERFENLTWLSAVSISTLLLMLVVGLLACGQVLAAGI